MNIEEIYKLFDEPKDATGYLEMLRIEYKLGYVDGHLRQMAVMGYVMHNRISELQERIAELEQAQRWIPVGERLPEVEDLVSDKLLVCAFVAGRTIVLDGNYCYCPEEWKSDGWIYSAGWYAPNQGMPTDYVITHWMPPPEPPEPPEGE